jgi:hypothetical protein
MVHGMYMDPNAMDYWLYIVKAQEALYRRLDRAYDRL